MCAVFPGAKFDIGVLAFYLFSAACPSLDATYVCKIHIEEKRKFMCQGHPRVCIDDNDVENKWVQDTQPEEVERICRVHLILACAR